MLVYYYIYFIFFNIAILAFERPDCLLAKWVIMAKWIAIIKT